MTELKMQRVDVLPPCPHCGSCNVVKNGIKQKNKQKVYCKDCGRTFMARISQDTRHAPANVKPELQPTAQPQPQPAQVDMVNEPPHYKQGKIQCWDAVDSAITGLEGPVAADTAKAIEYIWRHPHKGKPIEDLHKAEVYIGRLIARYKGETE